VFDGENCVSSRTFYSNRPIKRFRGAPSDNRSMIIIPLIDWSAFSCDRTARKASSLSSDNWARRDTVSGHSIANRRMN